MDLTLNKSSSFVSLLVASRWVSPGAFLRAPPDQSQERCASAPVLAQRPLVPSSSRCPRKDYTWCLCSCVFNVFKAVTAGVVKTVNTKNSPLALFINFVSKSFGLKIPPQINYVLTPQVTSVLPPPQLYLSLSFLLLFMWLPFKIKGNLNLQ